MHGLTKLLASIKKSAIVRQVRNGACGAYLLHVVTTLKTSVSEEDEAAVRRKIVKNALHRLCPEGLVLEYGAATRVLGAAYAPPSDEVAAEQAPATKRAKKNMARKCVTMLRWLVQKSAKIR